MSGLIFQKLQSYSEKSLTVSLNRTGARNNTGRITMRHHGGGHKRRYRIIDFRQIKSYSW